MARYDIDAGLAMIIKQRKKVRLHQNGTGVELMIAKANEIEQMDLVGNVEDSDVIIVDDLIDTAGTTCKAAETLLAKGGIVELDKDSEL